MARKHMMASFQETNGGQSGFCLREHVDPINDHLIFYINKSFYFQCSPMLPLHTLSTITACVALLSPAIISLTADKRHICYLSTNLVNGSAISGLFLCNLLSRGRVVIVSRLSSPSTNRQCLVKLLSI